MVKIDFIPGQYIENKLLVRTYFTLYRIDIYDTLVPEEYHSKDGAKMETSDRLGR